MGWRTGAIYTKPAVAEYANGIDKPSIAALEQKYGVKECVAMPGQREPEPAQHGGGQRD